MNKKYHIKIAALLIGFFLMNSIYAQQNVKNVLDEILTNNQQLKVAVKATERMKVESTIGLLPADPEVEFGYMWGNPVSIGNKKDFSISQRFEFPTVYTSKGKYSRIQQTMADKLYQKTKQEVVSQSLNLMIELIYHNKLKLVLEERFADAKKVSEMTQRMLDHGEVGLLEKDKADLQMMNLQNAVELCMADIKNLELGLKALNGNKQIRFDYKLYPSFLQIDNEESVRLVFLHQDAEYLLAKDELLLYEQQIQVSTHEYLPEFSVAYASETILDDKLKGIKAGISIPLWNKRNTIKLSKIALSEAEDQMIRFNQDQEAVWAQLWTQYQSRRNRFKTMGDLLGRIIPNKSLLMAFDLGEISLMEYITESSFYYESQDSFLELEKEMYLNAVDIKKVELAL